MDYIYYLSKRSDKNEYDVKYEYSLENNQCTGKVLVYLKDKQVQEGKLISQEEIKRKNFFELWGSIFERVLR
ncbi:MAG: hypothetical protein K2J85_04900 [Anaeroplasmataceae bacterium]|nr:hypothetical protein [Anaeroplasmataceae bacterium]